MAALRELALILGVEVDEDALEEAEDSLADFKDNLGKFALAAVAALGTATVALAEFGRHAAVQIDSNARQLGISREEYQQWAAVAEAAGVEGEKIVDVMANIQEKARNAALDPRGQMAQTFERLGIAARDANGQIRSGPALMRDAANALARMGPGTEQTATAMELFGDAGRQLLPVLGQGSEAIDRAIAGFDALGGGLSEDAIESSLEFNRALIQLKTTIMGALSPVLSALNPILTKMAGLLANATAKLREMAEKTTLLRTAMIALAVAGIGGLVYAIMTSIPAIVAFVIAWSPFIAAALIATAAVAALALGLDDLMTWFEGGDSVIGLWLDALLGVGGSAKVLDRVKAAIDNIGNAMDRAIAAARDLKLRFDSAQTAGGELADKLKAKLEPLKPLFSALAALVELVLGPLRETARLVAAMQNAPFAVIGAAGAAALDEATTREGQQRNGFAEFGGGSPGDVQAIARDVIARTEQVVAYGSPVARGGTSNTLQSQHTTQLNVNGVVDPRILEPVIERVMREAAERQAADIADAVQGGG